MQVHFAGQEEEIAHQELVAVLQDRSRRGAGEDNGALLGIGIELVRSELIAVHDVLPLYIDPLSLSGRDRGAQVRDRDPFVVRDRGAAVFPGPRGVRIWMRRE